GLDLADAAFDETLLLARGVVFGVLLEVAVRARFCDRSDDTRAVDGFQLLQFRAQALGTGFGHGGSLHVRDSLLLMRRPAGSRPRSIHWMRGMRLQAAATASPEVADVRRPSSACNSCRLITPPSSR